MPVEQIEAEKYYRLLVLPLQQQQKNLQEKERQIFFSPVKFYCIAFKAELQISGCEMMDVHGREREMKVSVLVCFCFNPVKILLEGNKQGFIYLFICKAERIAGAYHSNRPSALIPCFVLFLASIEPSSAGICQELNMMPVHRLKGSSFVCCLERREDEENISFPCF